MRIRPETLLKNPGKYHGKVITITARLVPGLTVEDGYEPKGSSDETNYGAKGSLDIGRDTLLKFWYIYSGKGIKWKDEDTLFREIKASEGRNITITGRFSYNSLESTVDVMKSIDPNCRVETPYKNLRKPPETKK